MSWFFRPIPKRFAELEVGAKFWDYLPDGDEFTKHGDEPTSARPFKPHDVVDVLVPIHVWVVAHFYRWFFGHWYKELQLWPFRRWFISWAFRCRWIGLERLSNLLWRGARLFAVERTHPALAAYTTKLIMGAVVEGRE